MNSPGYVAGCNPVRADLLITIKSLSGALYFDLSLHNIKGLYIKGGAKMIRLIGRDQRKMGNSSGRVSLVFSGKRDRKPWLILNGPGKDFFFLFSDS